MRYHSQVHDQINGVTGCSLDPEVRLKVSNNISDILLYSNGGKLVAGKIGRGENWSRGKLVAENWSRKIGRAENWSRGIYILYFSGSTCFSFLTWCLLCAYQLCICCYLINTHTGYT